MPLDAFARRLDPESARPVCVACSGGGDSMLALALTATLGRPVIALYVDHGLQAASAGWGDFVQARAAALGAGFRRLAWTGEKPATGIPAAARRARHALLANAARELGAAVVVTGHTADDDAENAALGQGALTEWSPSPVWPEGREVFLLRPLLGLRRAEVRAALLEQGLEWIDDPTNEDERQPRIRVRKAGANLATTDAASDSSILKASRPVAPREGEGGELCFSSMDIDRRTLAAALVSVGGGERLPDRDKVERLLGRLDRPATLAGAWVSGDGTLTVAREPGRRGIAPLRLEAGESGVFDGRFEVLTSRAVEIRALQGLAARLPAAQRARLKHIHPKARPALPVVVTDTEVTCPFFAEVRGLEIRSLVGARFAAACGALKLECEL